MKTRHMFLFAAAAAIVLLFAGCSTYISYSVAEPSAVSLGAYRNIAVASADYSYSLVDLSYLVDSKTIKVKDNANSGTYLANFPKYDTQYSLTEGTDAAKYAGNVITRALNQGYYTITEPTLTDALITVGKSMGSIQKQFLNNGIEVLIKSSISGISHDEYIEIRGSAVKAQNEAEAHKVYDAYYVRKASITLSYQVIDIANNTLITAGEIKRSSAKETQIGRVDPKVDGGKYKKYVDYLPTFKSEFQNLLDQCYSEIRDTLTPHVSVFTVSLAKDKTKDESLKVAYELADNGYYMDAYQQFKENWERTSNAAAGYNAALILGAMGKYEEGASLAREVYSKSYFIPALDIESSLMYYKSMNDKVKEQLSAAQPSVSSNGDLIGF